MVITVYQKIIVAYTDSTTTLIIVAPWSMNIAVYDTEVLTTMIYKGTVLEKLLI
jgi:hypothetical protein